MSALIIAVLIILFLVCLPGDDLVWMLKPDTHPNNTENYVIAAIAFLFICGCRCINKPPPLPDKHCMEV